MSIGLQLGYKVRKKSSTSFYKKYQTIQLLQKILRQVMPLARAFQLENILFSLVLVKM